MVTPDQEAKHRNRQTRKRDKLVAENILAREVGDQLADHTHDGQDHDVNGRMRIEPEQVLKENRIAAQRPDRKCRRAPTRSNASSRIVIAITGVPRIMIRLVA